MESSLEFSSSLGSVSSVLTRCRTFKVLVIGDSGVGKTCLTHRLCAGEFLVGNKSDLRDPRRADGQVSQELAASFAKAHGMMSFETSAKNPPNKCGNGRLVDAEVSYQQDKVEDIVAALGAKLKRTSVTSSPDCGSFKILNKKRAEKELWTCC
ncbi:hypothetical protein FQN60_011603 [Etheostoma spectabile]|uniref:Small monomeric GTPase n=1 Tax=Etheostoma spectabile TaxID=54343 RepID=A0A5J5DMS8_9PERO|nr:hypothetical protein FQN60_011603 [Etheostoma spectabile]